MDGGGHTISRTAEYTGAIFIVNADGSLTLVNITIDGGASNWTLDYDNVADGSGSRSGHVTTPILNDENDVKSTDSLIVNSGSLTIGNATVQNGWKTGNGAAIISNEGSTLALASGATLHHNMAVGSGGAIYAVSGSKVTIDGATFTENSTGAWLNPGGAITFASGTKDILPIIRNSLFQANHANGSGGAIWTTECALEIYDTKFIGNYAGNDGILAFGGSGMGQHAESPLVGVRSVFENCVFDGNVGQAWDSQSMGTAVYVYYYVGDGGLYFKDCSFINNIGDAGTISDCSSPFQMTFDDCYFAKNEMKAGGAFYLQGGVVTANRCVFEENTARTGGVVYNHGSSVTFNDCVVRNNVATSSGGFACNYCGTIELNNTTVTNNGGTYGGAVRLASDSRYPSHPAKLILGAGTTITGNAASLYGGGVYCSGSGVDYLTMEAGSAIYNNTAEKGGDDIAIYGTADADSYTTNLTLVSAPTMNGQTKDGLTIDGWYVDGTYDTETDSVPEDSRYVRNSSEEYTKAIDATETVLEWTLIKADSRTAVVSFDANGGDATPDKQVVGVNGTATDPGAITREGYAFVGWSLNGTDVYDFSTPVTSDITLVALWELIPVEPAADDDPEPTPEPDPTPDPDPAPAPDAAAEEPAADEAAAAEPAPVAVAAAFAVAPAGLVAPAAVAPAAPAAADTIADDANPLAGAAEAIDDDANPLANLGAWALVNLICAILTVVCGLGMLVSFLRKRDDEDEDRAHAASEEDEDEARRRKSKLLGVVPAVVAVVAFVLTEDMRLPMVLVDRWTLMMVCILAVNLLAAYVTRNKRDDEDEDRSQAAPAVA